MTLPFLAGSDSPTRTPSTAFQKGLGSGAFQPVRSLPLKRGSSLTSVGFSSALTGVKDKRQERQRTRADKNVRPTRLEEVLWCAVVIAVSPSSGVCAGSRRCLGCGSRGG